MTSGSDFQRITVGELPKYLTDDILGSLRHHSACFCFADEEKNPCVRAARVRLFATATISAFLLP